MENFCGLPKNLENQPSETYMMKGPCFLCPSAEDEGNK